uniref:Uncharacterized protein n=1 Tax=Glossina pallidipes TaxID=7398 RepID=A0A1A9ZXZ2_GLOPL
MVGFLLQISVVHRFVQHKFLVLVKRKSLSTKAFDYANYQWRLAYGGEIRAVFEGTTRNRIRNETIPSQEIFYQNRSPPERQAQLIKYYETTKQSKILDTSGVITHGIIIVDLILSIL